MIWGNFQIARGQQPTESRSRNAPRRYPTSQAHTTKKRRSIFSREGDLFPPHLRVEINCGYGYDYSTTLQSHWVLYIADACNLHDI
ncbi:hypothetical protein M404DRAFT_618760 [Pisolithus tinctorius Marx 270]|uniref:Uncharacterized protein n=1 Tax=Pisolithus tinctorius Marx 270 TaxID=870435 RepID=A0A0C3K1J6_PISTI|nr:hypothetical protein M404DRAFT_618760 [Pisolithus tinctorius Marx 270]